MSDQDNKNINTDDQNSEDEINPDDFANNYFKKNTNPNTDDTKIENSSLSGKIETNINGEKFDSKVDKDNTNNLSPIHNDFSKTLNSGNNIENKQNDDESADSSGEKTSIGPDNQNQASKPQLSDGLNKEINQKAPNQGVSEKNSIPSASKNQIKTDDSTPNIPQKTSLTPDKQDQASKPQSSNGLNKQTNQEAPNQGVSEKDSIPPASKDQTNTDYSTPNVPQKSSLTSDNEKQATQPENANNLKTLDKDEETDSSDQNSPAVPKYIEYKELNNKSKDQKETAEYDNQIPADSLPDTIKELIEKNLINLIGKDSSLPGIQENIPLDNIIALLNNTEESPGDHLMNRLKKAKSNKELQEILNELKLPSGKSLLEEIKEKNAEKLAKKLSSEIIAATSPENNNDESIKPTSDVPAPTDNYSDKSNENKNKVQKILNNALLSIIPDSDPFTKIDDQSTVIPKEYNNTGNQSQEEPEPNENEGDATPSNNQSANNQQLSKNQAKPQAPQDKTNSEEEEEEKKKESPVEKAEDVVKEVAKSAIKELIFQIFFVPPVCFYTWVTILITGIVICFFMATSIVADCIINLKVFESQCTSLTTAIADDVKKSVLSSLGLSGAELDERMSNKKTEPTKTPTEQAQNNSGVPSTSI